ncbi:MAG: 1,4-alpha-glucan branching protein GlgB [Pirellulales bacterium]|nr:1,4-alpha-glucan branching protein GlgB [Pirellulales bacterium]
MRTHANLADLTRLVQGRHENPAAILGPHPVSVKGQVALSVTAYDPTATRMWLTSERIDVDAVSNKNPTGRELWETVDRANRNRDSLGECTRVQMLPMRRIHPAGVFESVHLSGQQMSNSTPDKLGRTVRGNSTPRYRLVSEDANGHRREHHDPYAFPPLLTDFDLHLLGEGQHWESYLRLGAHVREIDGVHGVNFATWAPNAESVSVIGDFNGWDRRRHPLRKHIPSGFWELFVPGLDAGALYKFSLRTSVGENLEKSDPYGFAAELPPRTASVVADLNQYTWNDEYWLAEREARQALDKPISVYEVHLGSWRRDEHGQWLSYRELAHQLVEYVTRLRFTHIELLPVCEHPFSGSWGYQTVGYFAPTSRHGSPEDFKYLVDHCHQHGIGVILDWTPAHFPRDAHGLAQFDGTCLYEHADPRQAEHKDWGTLIFNYSRHEVRNFLIANALFWIDQYHIDGLRVDAVASMLYLDYSREDGDWVPNELGGRENLAAIEFLKMFNEQLHTRHPGVLTIAEESTAWPGVSRPTYLGGLGFSLKWNMGWMNDTLEYFQHEPVHRKFHHNQLTFSLIYAFHENFVLPFSHDEVVHGKASLLSKMPGDRWQQFANLRLLLSYMWTHPGKKLLFQGGEFGQWDEWNYDQSLDWHLLQWDSHQGLQQMVADLNRLLVTEPALHKHDLDDSGFEWIDCNSSEDSTLTYLRQTGDGQEALAVCLNLTPVPREDYQLGLPRAGWYQEVFNSDAGLYGGSNLGNSGGAEAIGKPHHGRPASMSITLPPLSVVIFKPSS